MNILHAGDKSPLQRGFFANSADYLLPALGFLDGLYNFCNFLIIFSLIIFLIIFFFSLIICGNSDIFYRFGNDQILSKNLQLK